jgi:hypothetical protein
MHSRTAKMFCEKNTHANEIQMEYQHNNKEKERMKEEMESEILKRPTTQHK